MTIMYWILCVSSSLLCFVDIRVREGLCEFSLIECDSDNVDNHNICSPGIENTFNLYVFIVIERLINILINWSAGVKHSREPHARE